MKEPEFLYPTEPYWPEKMCDEWKTSGRVYFQFCFLKYFPHTLPKSGGFWIYLYNTSKSTKDESLKRTVLFRVRVMEYYKSPERVREYIYSHRFSVPGDRIWFVCNQFEEIRCADGTHLTDSDFLHVDGKNLLSSIRSSLAPITCVRDVIIVSRSDENIGDK